MKDEDNVRNISSDIEKSSFGMLKDYMPTCRKAALQNVFSDSLYTQD